jgi:hypothetical protein
VDFVNALILFVILGKKIPVQKINLDQITVYAEIKIEPGLVTSNGRQTRDLSVFVYFLVMRHATRTWLKILRHSPPL